MKRKPVQIPVSYTHLDVYKRQAFTYDLTAEQMGDWAAAMGIEAVYIDGDTTIRNLQNELRWNSMYFSK